MTSDEYLRKLAEGRGTFSMLKAISEEQERKRKSLVRHRDALKKARSTRMERRAG